MNDKRKLPKQETTEVEHIHVWQLARYIDSPYGTVRPQGIFLCECGKAKTIEYTFEDIPVRTAS